MVVDPWHECIGYAVTLASQAGEVVHEALRNETNAMSKSSPIDLVTATNTDHKVEKMLTSSIKEKDLYGLPLPSPVICGSWGKKGVLTDNPTWVTDPTDGTTNFVHGCILSHFSCVQLFETLWTVACQAPLSMGFSRQESWSGFPFPFPGDLPDPGIKPASLVSCIGRLAVYH
uniref:Lithium-sensitive myo-inositol monophosphatase A1 n=1 Tax=Moschus moschiferus TaxID=68415 RepID=A0A8C6E1K0_MOSMO